MVQEELQFNRYPYRPGHKKRDTSRAAAKAIEDRAPTLRDQCLAIFSYFCVDATADEVAEKLDKSLLAIRPRITELARMGLITDTGQRRENASGKMAIVWKRTE